MENILVSHSGKQHSYKLAISIQNLGRLNRFVTSAYYDPLRFPDSVFSRFKKLDQTLRKRYEPGLSGKVKRFPFFEAPELIFRGLFGNSIIVLNSKYNQLFLLIRFSFSAIIILDKI